MNHLGQPCNLKRPKVQSKDSLQREYLRNSTSFRFKLTSSDFFNTKGNRPNLKNIQ